MRKTILSLIVFLISVTVYAQPTFDLGLKAGINNSKVTIDLSEYNSESVLKMHVGAFTRIGWGKIYVQPEAYFSAKGGNVSSNLWETATRFNFNNIDVPVLAGYKIVSGGAANLRIMAGPVFSFVTSDELDPESFIDPQYYKNSYYGFQYGVGVDFLSFFLDARMEHGSSDIYYHPDLDMNGKNQTFMITVGFKIL
ncbi:MAG TPA: porin family protein [Prolixibacteraceae bacterium]|nr:porin family protein [Prolixibacteraceae bacterium]